MVQQQRAGDCIDLVFPVSGSTIPVNHGYALYAAISRIVPSVHLAKGIGIFPIRGAFKDGSLRLNASSTVRLRVPAEQMHILLPLVDASVELDRCHIHLGSPRVHALVPAPTLISNLVSIKIAHAGEHEGITPESFLAAVRKQLVALNVAGEPAIPLVARGPHAGEPKRRVVRVKEQTHVGYAMIVQGLTAGESITLQEVGLGGRRLMGCGLFLPESER